ncbi:6-O-methylguanine DNA methyltransferase [Histoplasma capsulatum G186AR]|uniref:Methylated-DNA--protein-cysteine methyltransferase n=2 Tax=Ajellomyces capsulatus TaxID=5037 RepID=C0NZE8_AJECG|nr:6-O-methylguanine DNA methyltransferase [Histoplasma capsulatum G186AR]EEH03196.1 6-O-methylguanine DNA methyltransferase [Histoplasma capsulatum G186AR]KAG5290402.1 6-O-methylguanine DNA methyltransferase [Histoplasma capsulatum]QSS72329.1 6-O-methylguanine DNA methyltransferase [Histoplasma capsulatum G186AR]
MTASMRSSISSTSTISSRKRASRASNARYSTTPSTNPKRTPKSTLTQTKLTLPSKTPSNIKKSTTAPLRPSHPDPTLTQTLKTLSTYPSLTPHQRKVYRTLLSVPRGRWTTYAALAAHLSSSPRAIGNAMRTNPFAPAVPCHRVLASDRTVGGYKGKWGNGGDYATEKTGLLKGEGVVFDEKGRVLGECFGGFWEVK